MLGVWENDVSRPELISDYPHSELNLGVEKRRIHLLPPVVERQIAKRPVVTTTAAVLLAAAAAGIAAGLMLRANERRASGERKRGLLDFLG